MDIVFGILVVFGIALVGALVFGGWVVVAVVRLVARLLGGLFGSAPAPLPSIPSIRCARGGCRADNPGRARFCRRCGKMLQPPAPAVARRVAMW